MQTKTFLLLLLSAFLAMGAVSLATQLPIPPKGYAWVKCAETKSAFLKPDGWFFKKGKQGDIHGYFITKENIDQTGRFYTGLTVNIIPHIPKKKGMSPTQYAIAYIQSAAKARDVVKKQWSQDMGPFQTFGVVLRNRDSFSGDFITHNLAIGNDATGTFYLITFEAPASSWDSAWTLGEQMLRCFLIDSDI
jgi:hypothetical protein